MNKRLKQVFTVGLTFLLIISSGNNLVSAKRMHHYRPRVYKTSRRYHHSRRYKSHVRSQRNRHFKLRRKHSKKIKKNNPRKYRIRKIKKAKKTKRPKKIRRNGSLKKSHRVLKHRNREVKANDNIDINTAKRSNLWQPAIYNHQNAFGFYPETSNDNQFYDLFSQVLRKTSNKVRNEPFTFKDLKKLDYTLGHGGRYVLNNAKTAIAYNLLLGMSPDDAYTFGTSKDDSNYGEPFYFDPSSQVSYGDKGEYQQTMHEDYIGDIWYALTEDTQADRQSIGEAPLQRTQELDSISQKRAQQLVNVNFGHYDPNNDNTPYAIEDGIDPDGWGENIAQNPEQSPKAVADSINNSLFYGEEPENGIHYQNIANNTYMGIGVAAKDGMVSVAEDFE